MLAQLSLVTELGHVRPLACDTTSRDVQDVHRGPMRNRWSLHSYMLHTLVPNMILQILNGRSPLLANHHTAYGHGPAHSNPKWSPRGICMGNNGLLRAYPDPHSLHHRGDCSLTLLCYNPRGILSKSPRVTSLLRLNNRFGQSSGSVVCNSDLDGPQWATMG